MNKIRIFIFLELCIGVIFGVLLGAAIQDLVLEIGLSAVIGFILGLFTTQL